MSVKFDGESYDAIEKGSLIKPILTLSDIERQPWPSTKKLPRFYEINDILKSQLFPSKSKWSL